MLLIDRRENNGILKLVQRLDVDAMETELEYGDCCFSGSGPSGDCTVGIERKRVDDLINSMKDRRLSGHQIRGMRKAYDFLFLFIEGIWRPGAGDVIEVCLNGGWRTLYGRADRRSVSYQQVMNYLTTLELRGGVVVRRTGGPQDTAVQYVSLWKWFQKGWQEHTSHDQVYTNTPAKGHGGGWAEVHEHDGKGGGRVGVSAAVNGNGNPSTLLRSAMQLPGIDSRARLVEERFGTLRDMTLAGLPAALRRQVDSWYAANPGAAEGVWRQMSGIGEKTAAAIVHAYTTKGA
jgi:hypothetical protein